MKYLYLAAALLISGCDVPTTTPTAADSGSTAPAALSLRAVMAPTTAPDLLALGAVQLDQAAFTAQIVGKELISTDNAWNWFINADGTHNSGPFDKSYADDIGAWNWTNGQYCRNSADGGAFRCSDVYQIGNILRFSDADNPGKLATWAVTF